MGRVFREKGGLGRAHLQALEGMGTIQSRGQGQRVLGCGRTLSPRAHRTRCTGSQGLAGCGRRCLPMP